MIFVEASLTKPWGRPWVLHSWRVCLPPVAPPFNLWTLWVGALCQNMSSQTLGLINIISYNLQSSTKWTKTLLSTKAFWIKLLIFTDTFVDNSSAKCLIWSWSPSCQFWWFLFVKQFCQDMLVGVLFKEWRQCFFVENAHSWSIQNLNGHLRVKLDSIFTEFCKLCNLINGSLN